MKILSFILVLASLPFCGFSEDYPTELSYTANGFFYDLRDPGRILIQLESGEILDSTYEGIDFETLLDWEHEIEQSQIKRSFLITYRIEEGLRVKDLTSNTVFQLSGTVDPHPITLAHEQMKLAYTSTMALGEAQRIVLEAWEAELERIYELLGGDENVELKQSMEAWKQFRLAYQEYLGSVYDPLQGTIWPLVCTGHEIDLIKEQVERLQRIKEW